MSFCRCAVCQVFDPNVRPTKEVPGPPTVLEQIDAAHDFMTVAARGRARAAEFIQQWSAESKEGRCAASWLVRFAGEQRHWNTELRKWQSFKDVHPELATALITKPCRHEQGPGRPPTCWQGIDEFYSREVGADDDVSGDDGDLGRTSAP